MVKGMGGAMDLVSGCRNVIVTMEHTTKGSNKFFEKCTLPLTGRHVVDMAITDMAVFRWDKATREMMLTEIAPGLSVEDIKKNTGCSFIISPTLATF